MLSSEELELELEGKVLKSSFGKGKFRVTAIAIPTKNGVTVCILGGEKPHVGAVALANPRSSLKNSSMTSATSSVLNLVGHKDDEIARPVSEMLAKTFKQPIVVVAGLHIKAATEEDIAKLISNSNKAIASLCRKLK